MTKKESQNGSTMGINHYTINEKVSKTREYNPIIEYAYPLTSGNIHDKLYRLQV